MPVARYEERFRQIFPPKIADARAPRKFEPVAATRRHLRREIF
jgi:hypothetical protein